MPGRPRKSTSSTAILAAAIGLLRQHGYDGWTFDELARIAGIGKSSLYSRFPNRHALVSAAVASLQRELPPPSGELRRDLISTLRAAERNLGHAGPGVIGSVLGGGSEQRQLILGPVENRIRRLLPPGADRETGLEILLGSLVGRVLFGVESSRSWPEREVDVVLNGLAP